MPVLIYRNGMLMGNVRSVQVALDVITELSAYFPHNTYTWQA